MKVLGWATVIVGILIMMGSFVVAWRFLETGDQALAPSGLLLIYGGINVFMGRHWIIKAKKNRMKAEHERERELHQPG